MPCYIEGETKLTVKRLPVYTVCSTGARGSRTEIRDGTDAVGQQRV